MNIRDIDLNLLIIFRSLMRTLSVSATAQEMKLSQPAVSHALRRLRETLSDDLLVRSSRAMVATPFALELESRVGELLDQLEGALTRNTFQPATAQGRVRIQSTEYFEQLILPKLIAHLQLEAPRLQIVSTANQGRLPKSDLAEGNSDVAIAGFFGDLPEGFFQQKILQDTLVCLSSKDRPEANQKKISMTEFLKLRHVYISPEGKIEGGSIDLLLAKQKKKRQIVTSISGFAAPAWICTSDEYGCVLPQKLAELYTELLPLKWFELPVQPPPIQIVQVWHERTQRDPLCRFIRATIFKVCSQL